MDREKLEKHLKELRTEIEDLEFEAPESVERLMALADEIEVSTADDNEIDSDLLEGIQSNVDHFEVEHPSITALLNRIATLLSDMGI
ncbi:MAG: DUF4404 family protein [Spirochaetales bacterium]|uniref:DUF4404 family protein n=1 Tax=Candidatus Thalassospirochaeta sargassi TaxID=3119039 RepID=A0AAJ1IE09_9SPIO|nr:DUF4404 family protein [Spirochaetales bacterium]